MSETKAVLRSLFREINKYIPKEASGLYKRELVNTFRTNKEAPQKLNEAKEFLSLLTHSRTHRELLTRYNVGGFIEDRERLRKAGRRVGLQLPAFADEKDFSSNSTK
jgi:hypothetical protein